MSEIKKQSNAENKKSISFREERGVGYCGLACVLCSNEACPGCAGKIANGEGCQAGKCAVGKDISGCHDCPGYPCEEKMLSGRRNRAFNRYARDFGKQALIDRLRINYENGITYHNPDKSAGDYDILETEEEVYQLLRYGRNDPYAECPVFETEHFLLRQVCEDDAEDLLSFYGDLNGWMFFGNMNRIFPSRYATLEEMKKCISLFWLGEYKKKLYIRFSIIDKSNGKAVGTIEVYDNVGRGNNQALEAVRHGAALHIDLSAPYETRESISEVLKLADKEISKVFGVRYFLIRAVPTAEERIAALSAAGYLPFEWEPGREHYYVKNVSL